MLKYLARYTHRVAISNHRLRSLENGRVSFDWKDYADHSRTKTMTLDAVEFIRRFLLHVLPSGLVRIRHFGFLANRVRKQKLIQCRALLAASQPPIPIDSDDSTTSVEDPHACPICKLGRLVVIELLSAQTACGSGHLMIGATYSVLAVCTGSAQSLSRSLSPVDRVPAESSPAIASAPVVFTLEAAHSIFPPASFPAAFRTVSCKKPFNTQRLVPAPFNEFYPKRSGPTIPSLHAIFPPEHFR